MLKLLDLDICIGTSENANLAAGHEAVGLHVSIFFLSFNLSLFLHEGRCLSCRAL